MIEKLYFKPSNVALSHIINPTHYYECLQLSPSLFKAIVTSGCGSDQALIDYVPDHLFWLHIVEACKRHDFMYYFGKTLKDKKEADKLFLYNMQQLIKYSSGCEFIKDKRYELAEFYYDMVVKFGDNAFFEGTKSSIDKSKILYKSGLILNGFKKSKKLPEFAVNI